MSVEAKTTDCGCHNDLACWSLPPTFVRMRYYFGQRLGVSDFFDEQAYHEGKRRLLNRSLHGDGVLCGLRAERFVWPQGSPPETKTTVLRVLRGLALDACGREIVVGTDQCVDVNAWYLANKDRPDVAEWEDSDEPNRLCVGLRYRECPSDPGPAPRDPCGCDDAACEFGRIRESFELKLLTEAEAAECAHSLFPPYALLQAKLAELSAGPASAQDFADAVNELVSAPCPDPPPDPWLCLACFEVELADGQVDNIPNVDNTIPERLSLLSTEVLQALLLKSLQSGGAAAFAPGPQVTGASFEGVDGSLDTGAVTLGVGLLPDPDDPTISIALATASVDEGFFTLSSFDAASGWSDVAVTVAYEESPPRFVVKGDGVLSEARYRLAVQAPQATPIVDERMNALNPSPFIWQFRLEDQGGKLALADSLFP